MALVKFSIIVSIDAGNGMAKNGEIPWRNKEDKFFRDTTMGKRKNAVIMGRSTYESIPEDHRPLDGRKCVVVSRTWRQEQNPECSIVASVSDALTMLGASSTYDEEKGGGEVFIIGGENIFAEAIRDFEDIAHAKGLSPARLDADGWTLTWTGDELWAAWMADDMSRKRYVVRRVFAMPLVETSLEMRMEGARLVAEIYAIATKPKTMEPSPEKNTNKLANVREK